MDKFDKLDKNSLVTYSRYILRRLGHSLPKDGWLETYVFPGMQLSAFCKHCKKAFAITGPQFFDDTNLSAKGWKNAYSLFAIIKENMETERAWKNTSDVTIKKHLITSLDISDFKSSDFMLQLIFQSLNMNKSPSSPHSDPEPNDVIIKKIAKIDNKYYCEKIKTWI